MTTNGVRVLSLGVVPEALPKIDSALKKRSRRPPSAAAGVSDSAECEILHFTRSVTTFNVELCFFLSRKQEGRSPRCVYVHSIQGKIGKSLLIKKKSNLGGAATCCQH